MKLLTLNVNRGYRDNGALRGEVVFQTDDDTELKMQLDEQLSIDIINLCGESIARAGKAAAQALTSEALQVTAIEHDPK